MPLRIRDYVDCHHLDAWHADDRRLGADDRLQPVLPVVIHTGRERWSAAQRVLLAERKFGPEPARRRRFSPTWTMRTASAKWAAGSSTAIPATT